MDVAAGELVGRERELGLIADLLDRARGGEGGVLTFRGEPGSGKTSLLAQARRLASDFTVVACCGVEWEAEIPFSGLHELVGPLAGLHDALPAPQRRELEAALGLRDDVAVQGFHVHAAALSLLLEATRERPVLVIADDLQWIDAVSAQTLAFVGRRLSSDAVAMLVGTRPGAQLPGLPEPIEVGPLDRDAVGALAEREVGHPLPEPALDRLTRASAGNPLAVLESAAHAGDRRWLGGAGFDEPLPVGALIERGFSGRLDELSEDAFAAAVVVAESIADDDVTIRRAVRERGLAVASLTELIDRRVLVNDDGRWRFSHPLLRSTVHRRGEGSERRAAHAALARSLSDPGLAAWHAAESAEGPDADVADALAHAAEQYAARSGVSAAARAFERAADLTPDQDVAASRLVDAARAGRSAGAPPERLHALVDRARAAASSERMRLLADVEELLLQLGLGDAADARRKMLPCFERALGVDDTVACDLAHTMSNEAILMGDVDGVRAAFGLIRIVLARGTLSSAAEMIVRGELETAAILHGEPRAGDDELVRIATQPLPQLSTGADLRAFVAASSVVEGLMWIERFDEAERSAADYTRIARSRGDVFAEQRGCISEAELAFRVGDWTRAAAAAERGSVLGEVVGSLSNGALGVAIRQVVEGLRTGTIDLDALAGAEQRSEDAGVPIVREYTGVARGLAALTSGDAERAIEHLGIVRDWKRDAGQVEPSIGTWPVDLVHAHVLAGDLDAARDALGDVRAAAEVRDRRWALAAVPWLEALMEEDDSTAFASFELALQRYPVARAPFEEARARLSFGQRLRRANRRADARGQLEAALAGFERLGAEPWAERTRRELGASGKGGRRAAAHQRDELTLQERQVAALVAAGASNKEAAGELFLSPKTIETHLSRIYRKLGVTSRTQLALHWDERSAS